MNLSFLKFKKSVASALVLILFVSLFANAFLFPVKKAEAFGGDWANYFLSAAKWSWDKVTWAYEKASDAITSGVAAWEKSNNILVKAVKAAWQVLRKKMLDMLVDDVVSWIQGTGGKPKFVTDWKSFLSEAADKAGGDFVENYLNAGFLCRPLQTQLRIALQKTSLPFEEQTRCTLGDIENNLTNFYEDFNSGGWKAWASISENQNNFYGTYLFAMDQKLGVQSAARQASQNEAISSAGFLGDKVCLAGYYVGGNTIALPNPLTSDELAESFNCTKWENRTPGKILADTTSKVVGLDIDWLVSADEFNEYLSAILDAVVNRVANEGLSAMKIGSNYNTKGSKPTLGSSISQGDYTDTLESQNLTASMIKELKRLKTNLATLGDQYEANLTFLEEIKQRQDIILRALGWLVKNTCTAYPGILASEENGLAEIWDITANPKVLTEFPACDANVKKIKIELDWAGEIIFNVGGAILSAGDPCPVNIFSIITRVDSLYEGELSTLHKILDRTTLSDESQSINLIEKQRAAIEEAIGITEKYKNDENDYASKNLAYLKINPSDEATGQKKWSLGEYSLDLGSYAAMIPSGERNPASLTEAKETARNYLPDASPSEILSVAQTLVLNRYFPTVASLTDAKNLAAILNPTATTAEISTLGENLWGVKQEQNAQTATGVAKTVADKSLDAAIASILKAVESLDTENLSVASQTENSDLSQLYREIQEFSSNLADQSGSLESERGVSQKSPIKPSLKCDSNQLESKSLTGDLCNLHKSVFTPIGITFLMTKSKNVSGNDSGNLSSEIKSKKIIVPTPPGENAQNCPTKLTW